MGGGKSETYVDLQAQQIFASKDNLYAKELVRLFAMYKQVLPKEFTVNMIESSRKYFSPEVFEAMDVAVRNDAAITKVTIGGIDHAINLKHNYSNHVTYYFSTTDVNGDIITLTAQKTEEHLASNYNVDTNFQRDFVSTFDMEVQNHASFGSDCHTDAFSVYGALHSGSSGPDHAEVTTSTYGYEIFGDGVFYSMKDDLVVDSFITMIELDANWVETGTEIQVEVPEDLRTIYLTRCAYTPGDCFSWTEAVAEPMYKADIIGEVHTYRFLIFPIKDNGEFVEHKSYQQVLLTDLGLGNGALHDTLASPDIVKSIISYSVPFDNKTFEPYIEEVYGASGNYNQVVFNTPNYHIEYYSTSSTDENGNSISSSQINFDGESFSIDDRAVAILPIDIFVDMIMIDRYSSLNEIFRIWANTEVTVELKWYQTGLFKLVTFIIAAVMAIWSGGTSFMWFVGLQAGFAILSSFVSPEVMAIIAVVVAVVAMDFSKLGANLNSFAQISNIANNMSKFYFVGQTEKLNDQMSSYQEEQKAASDAIDEMRNDGLYIPMDSYTSYYSGMYAMGMDSYTSVYESYYDYDKMLKPKLGVQKHDR